MNPGLINNPRDAASRCFKSPRRSRADGRAEEAPGTGDGIQPAIQVEVEV
ncbi:MAG: hypothetical protein PF961_15610 [Planctomycetota bacterium]|nr:hypothetical protein [Planctomycetota bacterium]